MLAAAAAAASAVFTTAEAAVHSSRSEFVFGPAARVRVRTLDGRTGDRVQHTHREGQAHHHLDRVTLVLSRDRGGEEEEEEDWWTLDLVLNKDLVPASYFEKHQHEVGTETSRGRVRLKFLAEIT